MARNERKTGAILSYVTIAVNILVSVFYTPFMLRVMGTSDYGVYSTANAVIGYLSILDLGLCNALVRYNTRYRALDDKQGEARINGMFMLMYSVIGVITLIAGFIISRYLLDALFAAKFTPDELYRVKKVFVILMISLAVRFPMSVYYSIENAYERFTFSYLVSLIFNLLSHAAIIVLLMQGFGSVALAFCSLVFQLISGAVRIVYCYRQLHVKFIFRGFDHELLREIFVYTFYIFINVIVDQMYQSTDKVILGAVIGTSAVAVYNVAGQIENYFIQFSVAISGVFLPKITKIATLDEESAELSGLFVRIGRIQFILLSFILSGFIIFGRQFITLWAGPDYAEAYIIALLLIAPSVIHLSQNIGIDILRAKFKHKFRSVLYFIIALFNIAVSIPLAKLYGGIGAAFGTFCATLIGQTLIMNWYYHRVIGLDIPRYWREIGKIALAVALYSTVGILLNVIITFAGWAALFLKIMIYTVLFAFVVWRFIFNDYEKALLLPLLKKAGLIKK